MHFLSENNYFEFKFLYVLQLRYLCLERYNCSNAQTLLVGRCRQLSASSHFSANQNSSSPTAASADAEPPLGRVFDCKPVKMVLEAGKMYGWCTCGHSKKQVSLYLSLS